MNLLNQIIFWVPYLGTSLVLLVCFYYIIKSQDRLHIFVKYALLLIIGFFVLSWVGQILFLYFTIQGLAFADELTAGANSFFVQKSINISQSFVITLVVTGILYLVAALIHKFQKREIIEDYVPNIIIFMGLGLGFSNILLALILAFVLAIIYQLVMLVSKKRSSQTSIAPFLLLAAFLIRIFMIFPIYSDFLALVHLI